MVDNDQMSPDASPNSKPRSGVRRVNNLPLIIGIVALCLFALLIAKVALKRMNTVAVAQSDTQKVSKKNIDTRTMANEVLSGHGPGLIPSAMPEVPPAVSGTAGIPIAPVNNPDAPPMPPHQPDSLSAPVNPDEQQLRMAKLQQFQEAIKANSKITLPYDGSGSGSTSMTSRGASATATPQSREEMLAQIAKVRRQIDENAAGGDLTSSYQAQLARIRASLGNGDGGSESSPHLLQVSASSSNKDFSQFANNGQGDRWKLDQEIQAPRSSFEIRAGGVIPGVMISGVNSDLPGQIMGQVAQDVYDTATGKYLLIPQGTRLVGMYNSNVAYGQGAILIAWQRLVFPDGKALDISAMPGADNAGYAGFRDQANHHYTRIFGSALLMSGVTAASSYATDRNRNNSGIYSQPTASSELSQALGQQLGNVTAQMISKNLNIAPTLQIRPGYRFNIIIVKDLNFTKPYKSFDY